MGKTCSKCMGLKGLVVGVLLLLNGFLWPKWGAAWQGSGWINWFGVIFVVCGLLHLFLSGKCKACK